ncbi:phosphate-regulating neutral endopeptidase PHEX-like isoform X2 [Branchiostoma floridae x Branchiostoma japonicum]
MPSPSRYARSLCKQAALIVNKEIHTSFPHRLIVGQDRPSRNMSLQIHEKKYLNGDPEHNDGVDFKKGGGLSTREVILILVLIVVTVAGVAAIIVLATQKSSPEEVGFCNTRECASTAGFLIDNMDPDVDPCDNFFEFAVGGWKKNNPIPDTSSSWSMYSVLRERVQYIVRDILEEPTADDEIEAVKKAKDVYQSCMDLDTIEQRGTQPLLDFLQGPLKWPVIDNTFDESKFDILATMLALRAYNNDLLIEASVSVDSKNSSLRIITVDQPSLGLGRDYFIDENYSTQKQAYFELMVKAATALGADVNTVREEMNKTLELETFLAEIMVPSEDRRESENLYNKMTVGEMQANIAPEVDWLLYLNTLSDAYLFNETTVIDESEPVIVQAPPYLMNLSREVFSPDTTWDNKTIANYMVWRIVRNRINNLGKEFRDMVFEYNRVLSGADQVNPRWKTCSSYVEGNFGAPLGYKYVNSYFSADKKTQVIGMIERVRDAFKKQIDELEWMAEPDKIVAKDKADAIDPKVGYPEWMLNTTELNNDFEALNTSADDYFGNVVRYLQYTAQSGFAYLRAPINQSSWSTAPTTVNAFYLRSKNQIRFPAGELQFPFYWGTDVPMYLSYGAIGVVIGHEITHGFDDQGRKYDKDGNLNQWWSNSSIENFINKRQCIIDQYDNYYFAEAGKNLSGYRTQGENIADNGGMKAAFRAYREWVAERGSEEQLLPGIGLTQNQMFFLNYANLRCSQYRPQGAERAWQGVHSPGQFRVIGSMSNFEEFAKAYNCPVGTTMNRGDQRCSVW